jgi:polyisoprenoid-binding protein YceI
MDTQTVTRSGHRRKWLIAVPIALILGVIVVPFVYINFVKEDAPSTLSFDDIATASTAANEAAAVTTTPTTSAVSESSASTPASTVAATPSTVVTATSATSASTATATLDGSWTVASGSQAGYRVAENLFGQDTEGVGRTSTVTGSMTISGTTVNTTKVEVDVASMKSDSSQRDNQFNGRIMETAKFPTATFSLTSPIDLGSLPADQAQSTYKATGDFTIHGVTNPVTFDLTARRNGSTIEVTGQIPLTFADYSIPNPSFGDAIKVGDAGTIELALSFSKGT